MSFRVVEWVMDNAPRHGGSRRAVLLALAWHARVDGSNARPGHETIARRAGIGERTVRDALVALEAEGSIVRDGYSAQGGTVIWRVVMTGTAEERRALAAVRQISPDRDPAGSAGSRREAAAVDAGRSGRSRRPVRQDPPDRSGRSRRQHVIETSKETSETPRPESKPRDETLRSRRRTDVARETGQITIDGFSDG